MFDTETLSNVLHALATGFPDRVANLIQTSDQLNDSERRRLWDAYESAPEPVSQARALGDAISDGKNINALANECYRAAFWLGDGLEGMRSSDLFSFFTTKRTGRVLDKWIHYLPVYERYLDKFRGRPIRMLEIGVYRGGSMDMWEQYFGAELTLVGVDIDPRAIGAAGPGRIVEIGDQTDRQFLSRLSEQHGPFDIVLDDGGHTMEQQIVTAETMFPLLNDGGVLLVEDCHTSYWAEFGGGLGHSDTFIEWAKARVDLIHRFHTDEPRDPIWTEHVDSVHFHDSIVVLEKAMRFAPFAEQTGNAEFLSQSRAVSVIVSEMLATRDAAIHDRDVAVRDRDAAKVAAKAASGVSEDGAYSEELRLLRAEVARLAPLQAQTERQLHEALEDRNAARRAARAMRRSKPAQTVINVIRKRI